MNWEYHTLYFKSDRWERLKELARQAGLSVSEWIGQLIDKGGK